MQAPSIVRRTSALRVWSSAPDAPRFRRPTDVLLVAAAGTGLISLGLLVSGTTSVDRAVLELSAAAAAVLAWLWQISYGLLGCWAAMIALVTAVARHRRRLLLDYLLAAALAVALGVVALRLETGAWPADIGDFVTAEPRPTYTVAFLAIFVALLVTASPHLTRPLRMVGRIVTLLALVAAVGLEICTPAGAIASFAVGVGAGAVTHLLLGTPAGRSTTDQVADALAELGIDVDTVTESVSSPGASIMLARERSGGELFVKVYGRDAWDGQVVGSLWTSLTRRGATPVLLRSRASRVDHEAVVTLLAERAGVPVVPIVTGGKAADGDALLVTRARGTALGDLADVDDSFVDSAWQALVALHRLGIAHNDIDSSSVVRSADGSAALCGFDSAELAAPDTSVLADRARLLVATAIVADRDRALRAALAAIGVDGLAEVLPYLQPAVVDSDTGKAIRDEEWTLQELRAAAAAACAVEQPRLQQLRRVTVRSVLVVIVIAIVAYTVISLLAGVDLATIAQQLSGASKPTLLAALLLSPFVQAGFAVATMGASPKRLRYWPVLMLQYAIQFIAVTLPSTAARIALEVRFFERFGLPPTTAVSIGVIDSVMGFVVQIVLIVLILVSGLPGFTSKVLGQSASSTSSDDSTHALILLVVVLILAGMIIALIVPRIRRRISSAIPRLRSQMHAQSDHVRTALAVVRNPRKVGTMLLGNLVAQVVQAIILGVCLSAFGETAHLSQLILINTAVSLFAGLMPVPGGMGVAEAGYTAGLQAIGIPSAIAVSAAIAFRLVTFYLPPLWGGFAMRWLRKRAYV